eukprot:CAMPEP_0204252814 /NCGR_PEP_ID=MMETSP0468-20130131/1462_1 /ASSEMBLY_ACC=CAM_ASM_000383 /TAXON_ID=2969 /ORGANISM="Oxyrrhis marina" /LENGTH=162 /DNA_ID=CAMNT_0051226299 /DNA_START=67 /DNA_END=552 /DNA_ORIENTATION=-
MAPTPTTTTPHNQQQSVMQHTHPSSQTLEHKCTHVGTIAVGKTWIHTTPPGQTRSRGSTTNKHDATRATRGLELHISNTAPEPTFDRWPLHNTHKDTRLALSTVSHRLQMPCALLSPGDSPRCTGEVAEKRPNLTSQPIPHTCALGAEQAAAVGAAARHGSK